MVAGNGVKRDRVQYPEPRKDVKWGDLGFKFFTTDTIMVVAKHEKGVWGGLEAKPYGNIPLSPASTVLNYGQGIFEGVKARRTAKGRIVIFRPDMNARRFIKSAAQFLMPEMPEKMFMDALSLLVRENASWVPPCGEGSLYIRPLLMGTGPDLGVQPSSEYLFVLYAQAVGSYFKGPGAKLKIIHEQHRAAPGGVGHIKCVGNYAPCFEAARDAKAEGFSDVLYLDAGCEYIEEAAASNFFCLTPDGLLCTPELGNILPGVTRDSILTLARHLIKTHAAGDTHLKEVQEGQISLSTTLHATEAFVTGTGAGLVPICHIQPGSRKSRATDYPSPGPLTTLLKDMLHEIQLEQREDLWNWNFDPFLEEWSVPRPAKKAASAVPDLSSVP
eukprot:TRINITY_DN52155_c0_g1_i1.p1 TRINITY_DN52155_c0_g1~~TRINITY_DN52155_c0_g1_i1.p1  ORF type:complete len:387 (+),score=67.34 TRINITY_DN52155_c0_g1_i1:86-1246(+)